jgi:hypothetical protein
MPAVDDGIHEREGGVEIAYASCWQTGVDADSGVVGCVGGKGAGPKTGLMLLRT